VEPVEDHGRRAAAEPSRGRTAASRALLQSYRRTNAGMAALGSPGTTGSSRAIAQGSCGAAAAQEGAP
jgi:hypothetical protein